MNGAAAGTAERDRDARPARAAPSWLEAVEGALAREGRCALVQVAHVSGSVPRESGATMVVSSATAEGSVGGGHLEHEAMRLARDGLRAGTCATWLVRFPLAARLGQCCGGVATLAFTVLDRDARGWLDAARGCVRVGVPFACVGRLGAGPVASARLVVSPDDARGSLRDAALDSAAIAFARARLSAGTCGTLEMPVPGGGGSLVVQIERPGLATLLLFGNGHVAQALVQVLGVLPLQVRWIDGRDDAFPERLPDRVRVVATDVPEAELRDAPSGSLVLVMTHSHPLDFALVEVALDRDDWRYLGMIGSRSKRVQLERRLAARGIARERCAAVLCPIGARLPGLTGKAPGAIAVAVAVELMAAQSAHATAHATAPATAHGSAHGSAHATAHARARGPASGDT